MAEATFSTQRFPLVVLGADSTFADPSKVKYEFIGEGLELYFAKDAPDFFEALKRPECFAGFMSLSFAGTNMIPLLRARAAKNPYLVALSESLSTQQSSALFNAGIAEILNRPVHPTQIKGRARMLLTRFLRNYDLPADIVLPPGVNRRSKTSEFHVTTGPDPRDSKIQIIPGSKEPSVSATVIRGTKSQSSATATLSNQAPVAKSPVADEVFYADAVLNEVAQKLTELRTDLQFDRSKWPHREATPAAPLIGLDHMSDHVQDLFRKVCDVLKAERIFLLSNRAAQNDRFPEKLYLLSSSHSQPTRNEAIPSKCLPQVRVASDLKRPVYLNQPVQDAGCKHERPQQWTLPSGQSEHATAVFPILVGSKAFASLLVEFSEPESPEQRALLDQASKFFDLPRDTFTSIDFLCNVYRNAASSDTDS